MPQWAIPREKEDITLCTGMARKKKLAIAPDQLLERAASTERRAPFMLYVSIRMHAHPPTALVEPAPQIDIFIIAATEGQIETARILEYFPADEKRMTSKPMCLNVATRLPHIPVQIIFGKIIPSRDDGC